MLLSPEDFARSPPPSRGSAASGHSGRLRPPRPPQSPRQLLPHRVVEDTASSLGLPSSRGSSTSFGFSPRAVRPPWSPSQQGPMWLGWGDIEDSPSTIGLRTPSPGSAASPRGGSSPLYRPPTGGSDGKGLSFNAATNSTDSWPPRVGPQTLEEETAWGGKSAKKGNSSSPSARGKLQSTKDSTKSKDREAGSSKDPGKKDRQVRHSAPRPKPKSANDVWASPTQQAKAKQQRQQVYGPEQAAKVLISIVRQYPGVSMTLGLKPGYQDVELLQALAEVPEPAVSLSNWLSDNGCADEPRQRACKMVPMAIRAAGGKQKRFWTRRRRFAFMVFAGFLEVCVLSTALALWVLSLPWRTGECALVDFWGRECVQSRVQMTGEVTACEFQVRASYSVGAGRKIVQTRWTPPARPHNNRYIWDDPPFRCCDDPARDQRHSCCNLADSAGKMCDNWAGRFDASGSECHSGAWACRFRLSSLNGTAEEVEELEAGSGPPVGVFFVLAVVIALAVVCLQIYWVVRKRKRLADMRANLVIQEAAPSSTWEDASVAKWLDPTASDNPASLASLGSDSEAASDLSSLPGAVPDAARKPREQQLVPDSRRSSRTIEPANLSPSAPPSKRGSIISSKRPSIAESAVGFLSEEEYAKLWEQPPAPLIEPEEGEFLPPKWVTHPPRAGQALHPPKGRLSIASSASGQDLRGLQRSRRGSARSAVSRGS